MVHLKRSEMPGIWPLPRKKKRFAPIPSPGPHQKANCLPLVVVARDIFGLYKTATEAKKAIKAKNFLVDGKEVIDDRFPLGMMDVLSIKDKKEHYMVVPSAKGFEFRKIDEKKAGSKYCKVMDKTVVKNGLQLNLHDGRNVLLSVEEGKKYRTGDTVKIGLKTGKIEKVYPYKEGSEVIILKGVNRGKTGKVKEILVKKDLLKPKVKIDLDGEDKIFERDLVFLVPKKE
ncbi:MAG: 30S ribosomal protein S4e [Candidatus Aenigmarchaeota archaeon]|nr:30S ribosomal protein S4e [Candidatus Aenigmarchaeota archaeon]